MRAFAVWALHLRWVICTFLNEQVKTEAWHTVFKSPGASQGHRRYPGPA